jgi:hypothetical protein
MSRRVRRSPGGRWSVVVAALLVLIPAITSAQTPPSSRSTRPPRRQPRWEIAVYGGAVIPGVPVQGVSAVPGVNPLFATVNGSASLSRSVPSWFFASGANLFNQVATLQAPTGARMTTLDQVVFATSSNPGNGWSVGARVSRALNPRASIEGTFEYSSSRLRLLKSVPAAVEATRASFVTAWTDLFSRDPVTFQNPTVTATSALQEEKAHQIVANGALVINILTRRQNTPYVTAGAGVMSSGGGSTSVALVGRYTTTLNGTAPIDETDRLTLRYRVDPTVVAVTVGIGLKRMMGERWGIRVEMSEQLSSNPLTYLATASPQLVLTSTASQQGAAATPRFTSLQLSNIANSPIQSSLGGSLDGVKTFTATGMESRLSFTGGIFWRF